MTDHLIKYQFKKGETQEKKGGRPKKRSATDICNDMGFDPLEYEILIARNDWKLLGEKKPIPIGIRQKSIQKIGDKLYPNLKAIELKEDVSMLEEDRVVVILPSNDRELPDQVSKVGYEKVDTEIELSTDVVEGDREFSVPLSELDDY
tara:strand:+ start:3175 stop:3618 length:444 start_codon:yes stop_codon:yes gene_type:complete